MRAISVWQPWASAFFLGLKTIETRNREAVYRGPLLIHAAKRWGGVQVSFSAVERALGRLPDQLPLGVLLGVVELSACAPADCLRDVIGPIEKIYGDYSTGRFGWRFTNIRRFVDPIPFTGKQNFFQVPDSLVADAIASAERVD